MTLTMAMMETEKYMKRIRNTKIETLRIRSNTKTEIHRTMENTKTWMKAIGNTKKEDGDDKKHKDIDDYNDKKTQR